MKNIKLICDSLSDIPKDLINKYNIEMVPLTVIFNDKEYVDGVDLSKMEFYKLLRNSKSIPKTSQCTYIQFLNVFKQYIDKDETILYIGGSSLLSGTLQSATMAKNDLDGDIHIFDTESVSIGSACLVLAAADMIQKGFEVLDIISRLEYLKSNIKTFFTVDTLDYLKKGGRVSLTKATIGNMLNIKPIFSIEDGVINCIEQVRGKKQVLNKIISNIKEKVGTDLSEKRIILAYGDNENEINSFKEKLESELIIGELIIENIGSCISSHTGPEVIGIACCDI